MRFAVSMVRSLEVKTMQNCLVLASNGDSVKALEISVAKMSSFVILKIL